MGGEKFVEFVKFEEFVKLVEERSKVIFVLIQVEMKKSETHLLNQSSKCDQRFFRPSAKCTMTLSRNLNSLLKCESI